jgi:hypothetical protein
MRRKLGRCQTLAPVSITAKTSQGLSRSAKSEKSNQSGDGQRWAARSSIDSALVKTNSE